MEASSDHLTKLKLYLDPPNHSSQATEKNVTVVFADFTARVKKQSSKAITTRYSNKTSDEGANIGGQVFFH